MLPADRPRRESRTVGLILDSFGRITIEARHESFVIHPDEEAWQSDMPHPEFYLADLDDLVTALIDLQVVEPHV